MISQQEESLLSQDLKITRYLSYPTKNKEVYWKIFTMTSKSRGVILSGNSIITSFILPSPPPSTSSPNTNLKTTQITPLNEDILSMPPSFSKYQNHRFTDAIYSPESDLLIFEDESSKSIYAMDSFGRMRSIAYSVSLLRKGRSLKTIEGHPSMFYLLDRKSASFYQNTNYDTFKKVASYLLKFEDIQPIDHLSFFGITKKKVEYLVLDSENNKYSIKSEISIAQNGQDITSFDLSPDKKNLIFILKISSYNGKSEMASLTFDFENLAFFTKSRVDFIWPGGLGSTKRVMNCEIVKFIDNQRFILITKNTGEVSIFVGMLTGERKAISYQMGDFQMENQVHKVERKEGRLYFVDMGCNVYVVESTSSFSSLDSSINPSQLNN